MIIEIEVKNQYVNEIINLLKSQKDKIINIKKENNSISEEKLQLLRKISEQYKNGKKEEFVEIVL
jgi:predicted transcriptional regulator